MKALVKKCRNAAKYRWRSVFELKNDPVREFNVTLTHLLSGRRSPVIFDVGAHRGESVERFLTLFPDADIHTFEPDEASFAMLHQRWGSLDKIHVNNMGVSSAAGTLVFHRNRKSNTSGFHPVNVDSDWVKNRSARHNVTPDQFQLEQFDVPVTDIATYAKTHNISHIDLLKIDTQGHEDEVLKGCADMLANGAIDVIETELIVGDAYTKTLQFYDLEKLLIPQGYKLYGIDEAGDRRRMPDLNFNVLYVHERLLEKQRA